ncbi:hypothetical protein C8R43DRAFT_1139850 [Mycena crocata]|nr:hypothetical protein C8R43DRAFT_1139850 [Mycena crocata]
MPARGDRNAPQFDSQKPRELLRYFSDLQYLFDRALITNSTDKKKHATRFLKVEDQEVWETLEEYTDATFTYDEFKKAVLALYPGTDPNRMHTVGDLDALIGEYGRIGIHTKADFREFYRQFLVISKYLVTQGRFSQTECCRAFRRAIQPASLWDKVHQRLQIKQPDVHPQDPYDIKDMYEAVDFVLADTSTIPRSASPPPEPEVKQEALLEVVHELLKLVAVQQQLQQSTQQGGTTGTSQNTGLRPEGCTYCSDLSHYINRCPHVQTDVDSGKIRKDADGKIVLPTGSFVPRRMNGVNLRARVDDWHRQNPEFSNPSYIEFSAHL